MTADARPLPVWRSLDEAAGAWAPGDDGLAFASPTGIDRRRLLQLMAASLALGGLAGCDEAPDGGQADPARGSPSIFHATTLELGGLGRGVLVKSRAGRPVKIEGNPRHPASLGASDQFAQAEILSLYDPDRSASPLWRGQAEDWEAAFGRLAGLREVLRAGQGRGLHILSHRLASPTLAGMRERLAAALPAMRWHAYDPLGEGGAAEGARLAFGEPADTVFELAAADVILAVGGDLLGHGPAHIRLAHDFAERRRGADRPPVRLYAAEVSPSLTGARADQRIPLHATEVERFLRELLDAVRGGDPAVGPLAADLRRAGPRSLIAAGPEQPPVIHALAHHLNAALGAPGTTIRTIEPVLAAEGIGALSEALGQGAVETLLVLGCNPAYELPGFAGLLQGVPSTLHLGFHADETARLCGWHLPARHALESWGDLRAFDGTVGIIQPATAPPIQALTPAELLAVLLDEPPDGRRLVEETWRARLGDAFAARWPEILESGVVPGTALPEKAVTLRAIAGLPPAEAPERTLTAAFAPSPALWDGRFANNAWLQELPQPLTKQAWGNAALIAPATAAALELATGDMVALQAGDGAVEAPVLVLPGQAADMITLPLGYGRTAAGAIGDGIGFDAGALRGAGRPWLVPGLALRPLGRRIALVVTQHHHGMEGRDIVRVVRPGTAPAREETTRPPSFYPERAPEGHAWGMAIDLDTCLGCNACVVACQAENNVPVVGPEEVARGREMHWLRIDRYWSGAPEAPATCFQPVPCMHCEKAPCEVVCPVNATAHSSEGLNEMVYNRCIGTRTCSNNCPYKVRRFNWFDYADADTPGPRNPEVTIRHRGVMEKCTYCVQRIADARIEARMDGRALRDGDITPACAQACPTQAIVFGDVADPDSRVSRAKADARNYALLGELNLRPRTTYLARVDNPAEDGA